MFQAGIYKSNIMSDLDVAFCVLSSSAIQLLAMQYYRHRMLTELKSVCLIHRLHASGFLSLAA